MDILCFLAHLSQRLLLLYLINIPDVSTLVSQKLEWCLLDIFGRAVSFMLQQKTFQRMRFGKKPTAANWNAVFPCLCLRRGEDKKQRLPRSPSPLYSCACRLFNLMHVIPKGAILEQAWTLKLLDIHSAWWLQPLTSLVLALLRRSFQFQVKNIRMNFSFWWIRPKKDTRKLLKCQKKK